MNVTITNVTSTNKKPDTVFAVDIQYEGAFQIDDNTNVVYFVIATSPRRYVYISQTHGIGEAAIDPFQKVIPVACDLNVTIQ